MTDINKQIEEEARECLMRKCGIDISQFGTSDELYLTKGEVVSSIIHCVDSVLYSSRWRKASEELHELGIEVIITRNDGIRFLAWLDKDSELFFNVSGNEEYFLDEIQSWKPID